jgi:hypothetical protein
MFDITNLKMEDVSKMLGLPKAREINYSSLEIDGIDTNDAPDFCDAYFCYGEYTDGTPLPDSVLEDLSCSDLKYEHVQKHIY